MTFAKKEGNEEYLYSASVGIKLKELGGLLPPKVDIYDKTGKNRGLNT